MHSPCHCPNKWPSDPPSPYSLQSPLASPAPSPCACNAPTPAPAAPPDLRRNAPSPSPALPPAPSPIAAPTPTTAAPTPTIAASASASAPAPSPLKSAPKAAPPRVTPAPPPPPPPPPTTSGSATLNSTAPWSAPRRLVVPPIVSPGYAPVPVPTAIALHAKPANHHYAAIAGVAAAAFIFCAAGLAVLAVFLVNKRKTRSSGNGNKFTAGAGHRVRRSEPSPTAAKTADSSSSDGATATTVAAENTKKDTAGNVNSRYEDCATTVTGNGYGGHGQGRRRSPTASSAGGEFTSSQGGLDAQNVLEQQEAAAAGAEWFRNDELSMSGRRLGERIRDVKSVRTRNFATARAD